MRLRYVSFVIVAAMVTGCAIEGTVTDISNFETNLRRIHLENPTHLKLLQNGAIREISLKKISSVKIVPSKSITFEGEYYYGANVHLTDGTIISSATKKDGIDGSCYIAVQNELVGFNKKENYRIGLERVQQIKIKKK